MTDLVPRIDRPALERIIQRAAELQAREREIGEGLTETELMKLGEDVGIPEAYLRQAMLEEQTRNDLPGDGGFMTRLAGPKLISAQRTVRGESRRLEAALGRWMKEGELLQVKRRYPHQTSWEPQQGTIVSLKRSFGIGGRQYTLSGAREVVGQVVDIGDGKSHVRLMADLSKSYNDHLVGAGIMTVGGTLTTLALATLGFGAGFAVLPVLGALPVAALIARARLKGVERMHVALEQVLDRLEHDEIREEPALHSGRPSAFGRIVDEIKKNLEI